MSKRRRDGMEVSYVSNRRQGRQENMNDEWLPSPPQTWSSATARHCVQLLYLGRSAGGGGGGDREKVRNLLNVEMSKCRESLFRTAHKRSDLSVPVPKNVWLRTAPWHRDPMVNCIGCTLWLDLVDMDKQDGQDGHDGQHGQDRQQMSKFRRTSWFILWSLLFACLWKDTDIRCCSGADCDRLIKGVRTPVPLPPLQWFFALNNNLTLAVVDQLKLVRWFHDRLCTLFEMRREARVDLLALDPILQGWWSDFEWRLRPFPHGSLPWFHLVLATAPNDFTVDKLDMKTVQAFCRECADVLVHSVDLFDRLIPLMVSIRVRDDVCTPLLIQDFWCGVHSAAFVQVGHRIRLASLEVFLTAATDTTASPLDACQADSPTDVSWNNTMSAFALAADEWKWSLSAVFIEENMIPVPINDLTMAAWFTTACQQWLPTSSGCIAPPVTKRLRFRNAVPDLAHWQPLCELIRRDWFHTIQIETTRHIPVVASHTSALDLSHLLWSTLRESTTLHRVFWTDWLIPVMPGLKSCNLPSSLPHNLRHLHLDLCSKSKSDGYKYKRDLWASLVQSGVLLQLESVTLPCVTDAAVVAELNQQIKQAPHLTHLKFQRRAESTTCRCLCVLHDLWTTSRSTIDTIDIHLPSPVADRVRDTLTLFPRSFPTESQTQLTAIGPSQYERFKKRINTIQRRKQCGHAVHEQYFTRLIQLWLLPQPAFVPQLMLGCGDAMPSVANFTLASVMSDDGAQEYEKRVRVRRLRDRQWCRLAFVLVFVRANRTHTLVTSGLSLLPMLTQFLGSPYAGAGPF